MNHPDWVVLGTPTDEPGRVRVYASKTLTYAELRALARVRISVGVPGLGPEVLLQRLTLTAELQSYVVVEADSYAEAFASLVGIWNPEPIPSEFDPRLRRSERRELGEPE